MLEAHLLPSTVVFASDLELPFVVDQDPFAMHKQPSHNVIRTVAVTSTTSPIQSLNIYYLCHTKQLQGQQKSITREYLYMKS